MTRSTRAAVLASAFLSVAILGACRRKPVTPAPTTTTAVVNQDSINRVRDSIATADARRRSEQQRADSIRNADAMATQEQRTMVQALTNVVYFDYDAAELRADGRAALDAKLPILLANPALTIRIAGHTDERGSSEYNLALGLSRAAAVKRYLTDRGVAPGRIEVVSYGEEQPAVEGGEEAAWSQNRRAEFEITSPAGVLARPRR